jgi:hypothetical protein
MSLQTMFMFAPQTVPCATLGFDGVPFVQTFDVQSFMSSGTSASLIIDTTLPAPSH